MGSVRQWRGHGFRYEKLSLFQTDLKHQAIFWNLLFVGKNKASRLNDYGNIIYFKVSPTYYFIIYSHHGCKILFVANLLDSTSSEKLQRKSVIITTNTEMTSNYMTTVINFTKNLKLVVCIF